MGFITRAVGRQLKKKVDTAAATPEVQAAIERVQRSMALWTTAVELAGSALDDEGACAELRALLPDEPDTKRDAIAHLSNSRTSYRNDRAYRLLTAAVDHTAVRPIDPAVFDLFTAEAQLGRMSLSDGFAHLAALEPELQDAVRRPSPSSGPGLSVGLGDPYLTGPLAESSHPVIKTELATNVVAEYRWVLEHGKSSDNDLTPFFERTNHTSTGTLFTFGVKRPQANN